MDDSFQNFTSRPNIVMTDPVFDGYIPEGVGSGTPSSKSTWTTSLVDGDPNSRVLSRAEGEALLQRVVKMTAGGGETQVAVRSSYVGNLRWSRNRPTTSGITMDRWVEIRRLINGTITSIKTNKLDDSSLKEAVQKVENSVIKRVKRRVPLTLSGLQQYVQPPLWSEPTFNLTAQERSEAAQMGVRPVLQTKLLAAGYVATNVETWGIYNTLGLVAYSAATGALFGENVRNTDGTGSGWAGLTHSDWKKLNVTQLATRAIERCVASANPRAIEPGRYTTVLEAEAVTPLMWHAIEEMNRSFAEQQAKHPYHLEKGVSRIGTKIFDARLTIQTDPMDPDAPYIPFDGQGYPYRPVTWVDRGILKELAYDIEYARERLRTEIPLPNPLACRVVNQGPEISVEDMIASTERGVLVTRFGASRTSDTRSILVSTVTRDGVWLIENGKIRMPVKNMRILESPLFAFNNILQIGRPERVWGRYYADVPDDMPSMAVNGGRVPFVIPPMKVRDFNFIMGTDAV